MNSFQRRKLIKELKTQNDKNNRLLTRLLQVDKITADYETAHLGYYGTKPRIRYHKGFYEVNGTKYREREFITETRRLYAAEHERELNAPID